jgi:hypothetical protein
MQRGQTLPPPASVPLASTLSAGFRAAVSSARKAIGEIAGTGERVMVECGDGVGWNQRLDLAGSCAAHDFRRVPVVRNAVLQNVEEDIEVEQNFHRCL